MFYHYRNIKETKPNEYGGKGSEVRYDLMTINADSGKLIWDKEINPNLKSGGIHGEQDRRPVLVGDKIYFEPYCFDLKTGTRSGRANHVRCPHPNAFGEPVRARPPERCSAHHEELVSITTGHAYTNV